jgi:hypothetical protein
MAIRGIHGLFYSSDADATRNFLRDAVKLPSTDIGDGWLIFDFPEGDLGIHPLDHGGTAGDHDISFYCDDINGTVADLKKRGVTFKQDVQDHGYGFVTHFTMPGGIEVQLYEPKYAKPKKSAPTKKAAATKKPAAKAKAKATPKPKAKAKAKAKKKSKR